MVLLRGGFFLFLVLVFLSSLLLFLLLLPSMLLSLLRLGWISKYNSTGGRVPLVSAGGDDGGGRAVAAVGRKKLARKARHVRKGEAFIVQLCDDD